MYLINDTSNKINYFELKKNVMFSQILYRQSIHAMLFRHELTVEIRNR